MTPVQKSSAVQHLARVGKGLVCDLVISGARLTNWMNSTFLSPTYTGNDVLTALNKLAAYKPGFRCASIQFSGFTNAGAFEFPTLVEGQLFVPSRPSARPAPQQAVQYASVRLEILRIIYPVAGQLSVLPITNQIVSVSDLRLHDKKLHLGGVHYQTNELITFDVLGVARGVFATETKRMSQLTRRTVGGRVVVVLLAAAIFGGAVYLWSSFRRRAPEA